MFKKRKKNEELEALKHELRTDQTLCEILALAPDVVLVPFQHSKSINFLAVAVLLPSTASGMASVHTVCDAVVPRCKNYLMKSTLWGMEIFICREPIGGSRKIVRVMIPRQCVPEFSPQQIPPTSRNFGDIEIGCLWYVKDF